MYKYRSRALPALAVMLSLTSVPVEGAVPPASERLRQALFFHSNVVRDPGFVRAASANDAPVVQAFRRAIDEAMQKSKKRGYSHAYQGIHEALKAHRKDVPKPFFHGMQAILDFAFFQAHNQKPFKGYGAAREALAVAVGYVAERPEGFLGEGPQSFRSMIALARHLLVGRGKQAKSWMYVSFDKRLNEKDGVLSNKNNLAALGAARRQVSFDLADEIYRLLEIQDFSSASYFELARKSGAGVANDWDAYLTMRGFLTQAREVPHQWAGFGLNGLLYASNTYDEYGWIKYPIGSEEPYRIQVRRLLKYMAEETDGFPAYCAMLASVEDGKYVFRNYTLYQMLKAVEASAVPGELGDELADLVYDGDSASMRAFVQRVAAEPTS